MKPLLLLVGSAAAASSSSLDDLKQLQKDLPPCSIDCLAEGAAEHGCSITDLACQCAKLEPMIKTVSPCLVQAGCELEDITGVAQIVADICSKQANSSDAVMANSSSEAETETETETAATDAPGTAAHLLQGVGWTGAIVAAVAAFLV